MYLLGLFNSDNMGIGGWGGEDLPNKGWIPVAIEGVINDEVFHIVSFGFI